MNKDNINLNFINFDNLFSKDNHNSSYFKIKIRNILEEMCEDLRINSNNYKFNVIVNKELNSNIVTNNVNDKEVEPFSNGKPLYKIEQVILPKETLDEINKSLILIEKRDLIFEKWNLKSVIPKTRIALNFYGASGTGKTMTAHAIANKLNKKIMCINYSDIESKYVGDSAKNIDYVFAQAEKNNCILFFDEADSLLGKRLTSISSSTDQHLNSLRSQILIAIENFSGIVIFATNMIGNYDKAFETRIKSIHFHKPDFEARCKIWRKHIPDELPLHDDVNIEELAEKYSDLCGREIKEALLNAVNSALYADREILLMQDFIDSCEKCINNRVVDKLTEKEKEIIISKINTN